MNCLNCQHKNVEGASFCGNCGNTLATPVQATAPLQPVPTTNLSDPVVTPQQPVATESSSQPAVATHPPVVQPIPTQPAPQINAPVSSNPSLIKDRVKEVKWFSVSALLVGAIYGLLFAYYGFLYISDI